MRFFPSLKTLTGYLSDLSVLVSNYDIGSALGSAWHWSQLNGHCGHAGSTGKRNQTG